MPKDKNMSDTIRGEELQIEEIVSFSDDSLYVSLKDEKEISVKEGLDKFFIQTTGVLNRLRNYTRPQEEVIGIPSNEGIERVETFRQQIWFTPLLIVLAFTFGMLLTRRFKLYEQDLKNFFFSTNFEESISDNRMGLFQFRSMTLSVAVLSITLFCCFILEDILKISPSSFSLSFIRLLFSVILYIVVKVVLTTIFSYVFLDRIRLENLRRLYFTLITMFGFSLFIVVILVSYGQGIVVDIALWAGVLICCLAVILYLYKIFEFFFTGVSSLFYLILYLCTLEILPTVVFVWGLIISV